MAIGPTEGIKNLWYEGYFQNPRTLWDVENELSKKRINPGKHVILITLRRARFLRQIGKTTHGIPIFLEKLAPDIKQAQEIIYSKGHAYDFYNDIKQLLVAAEKSVFIVDSWVDEDLFDVYIKKLRPKIDLKILIGSTISSDFIKVARKFKVQYGNSFEIRKSNEFHDRVIFVDSSSWVFGQSLKGAGKKPTYLIQIKKVPELKEIYDTIWNSSEKIL